MRILNILNLLTTENQYLNLNIFINFESERKNVVVVYNLKKYKY